MNAYLTYEAGGNIFGLPVESVVEIMEYVSPDSQSTNLSYLLGLVDFRGEVMPLIDCGQKFGLTAIEIKDQTCTIVVNVHKADGDFKVALVVDNVSDVITVEEDEKQYLETLYKPGYIGCTVKSGGKLVLVLDVDKVFSDTEIVEIKRLLSE
jgi:chemotaxis signal transduction protein